MTHETIEFDKGRKKSCKKQKLYLNSQASQSARCSGAKITYGIFLFQSLITA